MENYSLPTEIYKLLTPCALGAAGIYLFGPHREGTAIRYDLKAELDAIREMPHRLRFLHFIQSHNRQKKQNHIHIAREKENCGQGPRVVSQSHSSFQAETKKTIPKKNAMPINAKMQSQITSRQDGNLPLDTKIQRMNPAAKNRFA